MKKIFLAVLFLSGLGIFQSNAQFQAGLVLGLDVPVGGFSSWYRPGICFGATGKYSVNEKMVVGGNLHYNSFSGDRFQDPYYYDNWRNKASVTAFTGLFHYYFSEDKLKPYAGADLGFYFWRSRYYYNYYWVNPAGNHVYKYDYHTAHGTALGIAPTGGITYDITDKLVFDGNVKFNLMITEANLNYVGFNLGLFYKFGE